jgi:hypothetical protein
MWLWGFSPKPHGLKSTCTTLLFVALALETKNHHWLKKIFKIKKLNKQHKFHDTIL